MGRKGGKKEEIVLSRKENGKEMEKEMVEMAQEEEEEMDVGRGGVERSSGRRVRAAASELVDFGSSDAWNKVSLSPACSKPLEAAGFLTLEVLDPSFAASVTASARGGGGVSSAASAADARKPLWHEFNPNLRTNHARSIEEALEHRPARVGKISASVAEIEEFISSMVASRGASDASTFANDHGLPPKGGKRARIAPILEPVEDEDEEEEDLDEDEEDEEEEDFDEDEEDEDEEDEDEEDDFEEEEEKMMEMKIKI